MNQPSQYSRLTFGQYSFSVPQKKERRSRDVDPFFPYCYHDDNFLHNVIMKIIFSYYYHEDNFLTPTWTLSRLNLSGSKRSGSGKVFGSLSKFFGQFSSEIPWPCSPPENQLHLQTCAECTWRGWHWSWPVGLSHQSWIMWMNGSTFIFPFCFIFLHTVFQLCGECQDSPPQDCPLGGNPGKCVQNLFKICSWNLLCRFVTPGIVGKPNNTANNQNKEWHSNMIIFKNGLQFWKNF